MNRYKIRLQFAAIACSLFMGGMLSSCEDDVTDIDVPDMAPGEWYIENVKYNEPDSKVVTLISENVSDKSMEFVVSSVGMGLSKNGDGMDFAKAKQFVIRSNSNWKIVPKLAEGENDDHVMMIPREGYGEMRVRVALFPTEDLFPRTVDYALFVNGVEQENVFLHIEQEAAKAYLNVSTPNINSKGGWYRVPVVGNVDWKVEADQVDWLKIDSITGASFSLYADANVGLETRSANIRVKAPLFPELDQEVTISQLPDGVYLVEGFDWLNCLSGVAASCAKNQYANPSSQLHLLGPKLTGENKIPDTQGWYIDGYNWLYTTTPSCYAHWFPDSNGGGNGYIKLSKTDFNGDVSTPALTSIEGKRDIEITFKAIAQRPVLKNEATKGGNYTDILSVVVIKGSGQIDEPNARVLCGDYLKADATLPGPNFYTDAKQFNVGKIKLCESDSDPVYTSDQLKTAQTFKVIVRGADNTTKITFIGGDKTGHHIPADGILNCIYIDDVVITDLNRGN